MAKRTTKTKAEKTTAEKAALRQRLFDLLVGANDGFDPHLDEENSDICFEIGLEAFIHFIRAVETVFIRQDETCAHMMEYHNAVNFNNLDKLADWLHVNGFRA